MGFTNAFSPITVNNYNASPPPDDGSQTAANQITWAKHKEKLADPIKTGLEALSAAMVAGGAKSINTASGVSNDIASSLGFTLSELTLSGFTVTGDRSYHAITATGATGMLARLTATDLASSALLLLQAATGKTITISSTATAAGGFQQPRVLSDQAPTPFVLVSDQWRAIADRFPWAAITATGASTTLLASRGVSGIVDDGTGSTTLQWEPDFDSANYSVVGAAQVAATGDLTFQTTARVAASCAVVLRGATGGNVDGSLSVAAFQ